MPEVAAGGAATLQAPQQRAAFRTFAAALAELGLETAFLAWAHLDHLEPLGLRGAPHLRVMRAPVEGDVGTKDALGQSHADRHAGRGRRHDAGQVPACIPPSPFKSASPPCESVWECVCESCGACVARVWVCGACVARCTPEIGGRKNRTVIQYNSYCENSV